MCLYLKDSFIHYLREIFRETNIPYPPYTYVCVSGVKKYQLFEIFCVRTKWMIPTRFSEIRYVIAQQECRNSDQLVQVSTDLLTLKFQFC